MATTAQKPPLKTYIGATMAEALAKVKHDLGAEAVIVHTRSFRDGGVMGLGARELVEITASSDPGVVRPRRPRPVDAGDDARRLPTTPIDPDQVEDPFVATPPWFSRVQTPQPAVRGLPQAQVESPSSPDPVPEARPVTPAAAVNPRPSVPVRAPTPTPRADAPQAPNALGEAQPSPSRADPPSAALEAKPPKPARAQPKAVPNSGAGSGTSPDPWPKPTAITKSRAGTPSPEVPKAVEQELAAIRRLVGQVLHSSRRVEAKAGVDVAPPASTGPLFDLSLRLLDHQVPADLVDTLTSDVRVELAPPELEDETATRDALLRHIAKRLPVVAEAPPRDDANGRPTVVALVGPTGVGKTTTVAKLAAASKLRAQRKVGLITADTYRIAAVEQLRTYADIVGIPLRVALAPADVEDALDALSDCDLVILDTAGRSQRDQARLDELAEFLDAAKPDHTHLVLSLAASQSVMLAAAERYARLGPDRVILTKLDEAMDYGVVCKLAGELGLPFSYVTTGQEVPDDVEPANAERLARLVLEGEEAWRRISGGR